MAQRKRIQPDQTVSLSLSKAERQLVLDQTFAPKALADRLRLAMAEQTEFHFTLAELEELHGYVAAAANHADSSKLQKQLDRILLKIDRLMETYTDQDSLPNAAGTISLGDLAEAMAAILGGAFDRLDDRIPVKPGDPIDLNLPPSQRQTIIEHTDAPKPLKDALAAYPAKQQSVPFTLPELNELHDALCASACFAGGPFKQKLARLIEKVRTVLDAHVLEEP